MSLFLSIGRDVHGASPDLPGIAPLSDDVHYMTLLYLCTTHPVSHPSSSSRPRFITLNALISLFGSGGRKQHDGGLRLELGAGGIATPELYVFDMVARTHVAIRVCRNGWPV